MQQADTRQHAAAAGRCAHACAPARASPPPLSGNSVCVFVHGFQPYFYCDCPQGWVPEDYQELLNQLNVSVQAGAQMFSLQGPAAWGCMVPRRGRLLPHAPAAAAWGRTGLAAPACGYSGASMTKPLAASGVHAAARPDRPRTNPQPLQRHPRLNEGRGKGGLGVPPVASVEPVTKADLWTYQFGKQRTYLKVGAARAGRQLLQHAFAAVAAATCRCIDRRHTSIAPTQL